LRVSVIVPAFDEEAELPGLFDHLDRLDGDWEVLLADGGSRDRTVEIARERGATVVGEGAHRAGQLNAAAGRARGEILVFLHADSRLPAGAFASLRATRAAGGNFALRFGGGDRFARVLTRAYAFQRRFGFYYGDSTIWLRPGTFTALGGFRDLPIMDDYDLVRRMEKRFDTACLPGPGITSPRRWRAMGIPRTLVTWWAIRLLFVAGVPAHRLAGLYGKAR
jgi:rSAM/selenodomain-associated transferase 2